MNQHGMLHQEYLVEVKLAHERTGEGMAAVHRHDNRTRMSRGEQGCDCLK